MKRLLRAALLALALLVSGSQAAQLAAQDNAVAPRLQALANGLKPQHGKIAIPGANATLDLGRDYDFYGGPDIRTILVDLWDNPPGSEEGVLGLVMPAGASPLSDSWGAVIGYEETGYVPDDDAASADYGQILSDLKQNAEDANPERKNQGYPAMHMVGWAENPHYQAATHSVVWARDLQLEGVPVDTLNYDLRTLGRKGVLSVNFISGMPNLAGIRVAAGNFAEHASFDPGARYQDFDSATDKKAEYGIAGLVAAGVGVAAVKKLGLLAIILKFGKVIALAVVAGLAVARKFVARLFGFGKDSREGWHTEADALEPGPRGDLSGVSEPPPEERPPGS